MPRGKAPAPRAPAEPARSRRVLRKRGVIDDGVRRRDRRDWLSVIEEGHPELKAPRKETAA